MPGSPVAYRCWGHPAHVSWAHFLPWGSINRIFPGYFGVGYPGVRTTFSYLAIPLVFYTRFLDKTNFARIPTRRARYLQDPSTIPTGSGPWTIPYAPVAYRCGGHPANASWPLSAWGSIKLFSPGTLSQWGKGATIPTTSTRFRTWTLTACRLSRGQNYVKLLGDPKALYPRFLDKTSFPKYRPRGPGTHRTILQSPHVPVSDLCPTLPRRTAAGGPGTRARYSQDPSTIPTRSGPWTVRDAPAAFRWRGPPAHVSWSYFPPGAR